MAISLWKRQQKPCLLRQIHADQRHSERSYRKREANGNHAQQHCVFDYDRAPLFG